MDGTTLATSIFLQKNTKRYYTRVMCGGALMPLFWNTTLGKEQNITRKIEGSYNYISTFTIATQWFAQHNLDGVHHSYVGLGH